MQRTILHIDFDSFFASCEQQYRPELRGKPVGVTAHNGRTAIIAASREAKKAGLRNVMRSYDAFRICPDLQLVTADFRKYWTVSKKFISICNDFSPYVEVFSIDEVFMDITLTAHLYGGVNQLIHILKNRLKKEVGEYVTVSVGISYNKLLAKLASGLKKPNGIFQIQPHHVEQVYKITPLEEMCGIGPRIHTRLNAIGIYTLIQLRKAPLASLIAEFGPLEGTFLKNVGLGIDTREIVPYTQAPEAKSISRQHCLGANEYDRRVVTQHLYELCEELGIKLRRLHKKARAVGFSLRGTQTISAHATLSAYIGTGQEIFMACSRLTQTFGPSHIFFFEGYVRRLGVWVGNLASEDTLPLSLFPEDTRRERLQIVVDQINETFGDHTIRNGFLLHAQKHTTVPNGYLGDRYERKKLVELAP